MYSVAGEEAGLLFLPMTLTIFAASSLAPRLVARFGSRQVITTGMITATVGLGLLRGVAPQAGYLATVLPGALLTALGMGLSLVPATIVAMQGLPASQSGLGSGLLNTSRLMGGALGLAILSTIADARTKADTAAGAAHSLTSGFDLAFAVGAGFCLAGALVAGLMLRRAPREEAAGLEAGGEVGASAALNRAEAEEGQALAA